MIEVKAFGLSARGNDLWLETRVRDVRRARTVTSTSIVDNVRQGNPAAAFRLIDLHGDVLACLVKRARPQTYMTVPRSRRLHRRRRSQAQASDYMSRRPNVFCASSNSRSWVGDGMTSPCPAVVGSEAASSPSSTRRGQIAQQRQPNPCLDE